MELKIYGSRNFSRPQKVKSKAQSLNSRLISAWKRCSQRKLARFRAYIPDAIVPGNVGESCDEWVKTAPNWETTLIVCA